MRRGLCGRKAEGLPRLSRTAWHKRPAAAGRLQVHLGKGRPARPLSLAPSHRFTPDEDGQTPDHLLPGALPPLPRPGEWGGGLCSPSGVPPRDCVRSVTRKPGLERRRARRDSRSPELKCPDHARRGAVRHVRATLAGGRLSRASGSRGLRRARWRRGRAGRGARPRRARGADRPALRPGPRRLCTRADGERSRFSPERWLAPGVCGERLRAAQELPARAP